MDQRMDGRMDERAVMWVVRRFGQSSVGRRPAEYGRSVIWIGRADGLTGG